MIARRLTAGGQLGFIFGGQRGIRRFDSTGRRCRVTVRRAGASVVTQSKPRAAATEIRAGRIDALLLAAAVVLVALIDICREISRHRSEFLLEHVFLPRQ